MKSLIVIVRNMGFQSMKTKKGLSLKPTNKNKKQYRIKSREIILDFFVFQIKNSIFEKKNTKKLTS